MAVKLISQAPGSYCCGQCCVAMVAGVTLEEALKAVGRKGSTSTKRLQGGLKKLGIRAHDGRLQVNRGALPLIAILKVKTPWRRSGWHWILKVNKKAYDPARGVYLVAEYTRETDNIISSYLEVKNG